MDFLNIIFGAVGIASVIFTLFPGTLDELRKMDSYRLVVFCIFIVCLIYWIIFTVKYILKKKKRVRIIKDSGDRQDFTYLLEGNECRHIPDPPTFNYLGSYFGFSWKDLELISTDEFKRKFTVKTQLPSILSHIPVLIQKNG